MFTVAAILMVISVVTLVWIHLREEKRRAKRYAELFMNKKEQEEVDQKQKELKETENGEEDLGDMSLDQLAAGIKKEIHEAHEQEHEEAEQKSLTEVELAMQEIQHARDTDETSTTTTDLELDQ